MQLEYMSYITKVFIYLNYFIYGAGAKGEDEYEYKKRAGRIRVGAELLDYFCAQNGIDLSLVRSRCQYSAHKNLATVGFRVRFRAARLITSFFMSSFHEIRLDYRLLFVLSICNYCYGGILVGFNKFFANCFRFPI